MVSWCKDYFSSALWRDSKTKQQHSEKNKKKSECCRKIRNHLKRKLWLTSEQINFLVLSSGSCLQPAAHCVKRLLKKGFIIQWWWQSQTENSVIHKAELQLKQRAKLSAEDWGNERFHFSISPRWTSAGFKDDPFDVLKINLPFPKTKSSLTWFGHEEGFILEVSEMLSNLALNIHH